MSSEPRTAWYAAFFVLGMVFMLAIIGLSRPEWFLQSNRAQITTIEAAARVPVQPPEPEQMPAEEIPPSPILVEHVPEPIPTPLTKSFATEFVAEAPAPGPPAVFDSQPGIPAPAEPRQIREPNPQVTAAILTGRGHRIIGRAVLASEAPPEKAIPADPSCGSLPNHPQSTRIFNVGRDKGLADVVVTVIDGPQHPEHWPVPVNPHVIEARNCLFEPYISAMQVNQPLEMRNSDGRLHNAHITPNNPLNLERNFVFLPGNKPARAAFSSAEHFIRIKCDVHPWMLAYISVFQHPLFAVTDREGTFEIKNVPPGSYTVLATHRKAGYFTNVVEVTDRTSPSLNFEFTAASEVASRR